MQTAGWTGKAGRIARTGDSEDRGKTAIPLGKEQCKRRRDMAYHVMLDTFEGPLDLLLYLIGQARIEIRDIFVHPIIDQYLAYVRQMPANYMDRTAEFVAMAARLLEIKSRWLLPKEEKTEETEEDLEQDLIRQLELYRQYKDASEKLKARKEQADLVYYRLPDERYLDEKIVPAELTIEKLVSAFEEMRSRLMKIPEEEIGQPIERDHFTVREKIYHITHRILTKGKVRFSELFEAASTREEVVVTFLALLELVRNNIVGVEQKPEERDILIIRQKEVDLHGTDLVTEESGY